MLAGKSRETLRLVSSSGKTVGDDKFAADKKAGNKEFYLTDKQLTELQSRQKESFAKRQPTMSDNFAGKDGINAAEFRRTQLERKYETQKSEIPVDVMSARNSNAERTVQAKPI